MKRILALVMIVLLAAGLLPAMSGCSEPAGDSGKDDNTEITKLPSKIDLRDYDGKNYVTPVKSQLYGDCWAFSLAGSAEIAYLFANDMGVPAGEVNDQVDFSEKYILWYVFHAITEDDVVKGKIRSSQVGEGFDLSMAESSFDRAAYIIGGQFVHCVNFFGSGFGPVDESVAVKGEYPYAYDDVSQAEWKLPLNAEYRNAPQAAFLRQSCLLPCPAGTDENGSYAFNEDGVTAIKSELCRGHGVSLAYNSTAGINTENMAVYHGDHSASDQALPMMGHAVTVVGYDDDYSKDHFTVKDYKGNPIDGTTPPDNGAFIIKNSWGVTGSDAGQAGDGYFYLSYYDQSILSPLSLEFDDSAAFGTDAFNYDQYDLMMTEWYASTDHDSETKTANVFDAEEDESLYQISYITAFPDTEVSYEIYRDVKKDDPSSGELLEKGTDSHRYAGSHKIDLQDTYPLKKGEKYSVVLTMKRAANDGDGMVYTEVFPYSTPFYEGMNVRGIINQGESRLYTDGKWSDMTEHKESLIERAYRQCTEKYASTEDAEKLRLDSKDSFAVDNYPIKAILIPDK